MMVEIQQLRKPNGFQLREFASPCRRHMQIELLEILCQLYKKLKWVTGMINP